MLSGRVTHSVIRLLDCITNSGGAEKDLAAHHRTGCRGEEDAYFYLRRHGYVIVARNFRTTRHHGEIDLIGWDQDVLCFIEVKTRTTRDVKTAQASVDRDKRRALRRVVRDYLHSFPERQFPQVPQWRFDVVTVYYEKEAPRPVFELFRNAALSS
jgi:putative endonuclease